MGKNAQAMRQAALLALRLYNEVAQKRQQGESFWIQEPRPWSELICKYAYDIRSELKKIFKQIVTNKWIEHISPYAELVAYILKEANTKSLYPICLCCKDDILELLKLFWLEIPEEKRNDDFYSGRLHSRAYVFGLNGEFVVDMSYFPVSAQQTPLYALFSTELLLDNEGTKVLEFVIKFINTCIETYSKRNDVDELRNITVTLPDGMKHDIIASTSLWNLYRCTSSVSMPNLLECMHMALESFLFSLVENEKETNWDYVEKALWMLLLHSKSASLYAVAASLAVAYPVRLYDILLFLCQDIRFISMDLTRSISEQHATLIEFAYHQYPSLLEERKKSNKKPHRQRCLETTLLNCQVAFDHRNDKNSKEKLKRAYEVVNQLRKQKEELEEEDSTYKFIFERIDYRSMKKKDAELKNGQKVILLTPNSTPEMEKERVERRAFSKHMEAVALRLWADQKYKNGGREIPKYRYDKDTQYALEVVRAVEKQVTERDDDFLLMSVGMIFMFVACGGDKEKTEAAPEAQGSNELVIYSPNADDEVNKIIPAFEKATGIKVILQSMGSGDVLARISAEKENPQADINWGAISMGVLATTPDLWESYTSENEKNVPDAYKNTTGFFTNYKLDGSAALLVNKDVFKKLGLDPEKFTGYKDLLLPELKGKIAMGDPTASSSAIAELTNMLLVMGEKPYDEKAWEFVEKFIAQLDGTILSSSSQIYKATADGEYAVGVTYENPAVTLLQDGATNLKLVYPEEGSVWLPGAAAIVKNAPHMENAKKFVDFLISDEGQKIVAETSTRPVNTAIKNTSEFIKPFDEIKVAYEDIPYCAEHRKEWQERWTNILTK